MNLGRIFLSIVHSKSKTFLAFCFSFLAGVGVASIGDIRVPFLWVYLAGFLTAAACIAFWTNKINKVNRIYCFFVLSFFCFLIGAVRYTIAFPGTHDISRLAGREVTLTGYVAAEPDVRIDGVRYIISVITTDSPRRGVEGSGDNGRGPDSSTSLRFARNDKSDAGHVYVSIPLYPRYHYGDILSLHCDVEKPKPIEEKDRPGHVFRWDMYLARFGVFAVCRNTRIEKIGEGRGSRPYSAILSFKDRVQNRVAVLWHEPYASFMAGLLYGYRGGLGELNEAFVRAGVSHILAISGYNIGIIVAVVRTMFAYLHIRRQRAFWAITAGLIVFTALTGASASVVRAAVFGWLLLLGPQVGRIARPFHLLVPAAALMVALNPIILMWDAGFQLSVLATLGIMAIPPLFAPITERFSRWRFALDPAIVTVSAMAFTLPAILYHFGRLSLLALPANLLVVWMVPILMLAGFIAIAASFIWHPSGVAIALIAYAGMKYITMIVIFFSSLPFAAVLLPLPWWGALAAYGMLGIVYRTFDKRQKQAYPLC